MHFQILLYVLTYIKYEAHTAGNIYIYVYKYMYIYHKEKLFSL